MNAEEFVYRARLYGYPYVTKRFYAADGYHVCVQSDKDGDIIWWQGPDRESKGHASKVMANMLAETAQVQRVADEVRAR